MILNIYLPGAAHLTRLDTIKVKKIYEDSFYHCPMYTIGAKTCKRLIKKAYNGRLFEKVLVILEDDKTKSKKSQYILKNGTILHF